MSGWREVRAHDPSGALRYRWMARVIETGEERLILGGDYGRALQGAAGSLTEVTNRSVEFYWADRPYTVAMHFDRASSHQGWYARLIRPLSLAVGDESLDLTLLGLDLEIDPEGEFELLERADLVLEPEEDQLRSDGLVALLELIERREPPFDGETVRRFG